MSAATPSRNGRHQTVVSAPGKLMLSGEYAVLHGAPAVVAAVDRRARAWLSEFPAARLHPEVIETRRLAEAQYGAVDGHIHLNTDPLRHDDKKLGLGSSAAGAACAAALVMATHGVDLDAERDSIFELAWQGHRAVSPSGSGADVAAATFGGVLSFEANGDLPNVGVCALPDELQINVLWTEAPASTHSLVSQVQRAAVANPRAFDDIMSRLVSLSEAAASAWRDGEAERILATAALHHVVLGELGVFADAAIITPALDALASDVRALGGAFKPSGAGGGDVGLAMFSQVTDFEHVARLSLKVGCADGVRVDERSTETASLGGFRA